MYIVQYLCLVRTVIEEAMKDGQASSSISIMSQLSMKMLAQVVEIVCHDEQQVVRNLCALTCCLSVCLSSF